jgi:hypothetical protein
MLRLVVARHNQNFYRKTEGSFHFGSSLTPSLTAHHFADEFHRYSSSG